MRSPGVAAFIGDGGFGIQGSPSAGWTFPKTAADGGNIVTFSRAGSTVGFVRDDGIAWFRRTTSNSTLGDSRVLILRDASGLANSRFEIGFGFHDGDTVFGGNYQPVVIGSQITDGAGNTKGNFYIATRDVTTDTAPTIRLEVTAAGLTDASGTIRATGNVAAISGKGTEVYYDTGLDVGVVQAYDRGATAYKPLWVTGSVVSTVISGGTVAEARASGFTVGVPVNLKSYTVATLPSAATAGGFIYVSNEVGGAVPAFSDGANWRRVTDRAIVA